MILLSPEKQADELIADLRAKQSPDYHIMGDMNSGSAVLGTTIPRKKVQVKACPAEKQQADHFFPAWQHLKSFRLSMHPVSGFSSYEVIGTEI